MKIQIRRCEEASGDVFYRIYVNDSIQKSFSAGNVYDEDFKESDKKASEKAKTLYDNMVEFGTDKPKVTIIESTEI